jgi:hypothetical protein
MDDGRAMQGAIAEPRRKKEEKKKPKKKVLIGKR